MVVRSLVLNRPHTYTGVHRPSACGRPVDPTSLLCASSCSFQPGTVIALYSPHGLAPQIRRADST